MITIFIRTIIIYFTLIFTMKLMGKRQVGELQLSELITTFMLSELAALPISDKNIPLFHALLPTMLLISLEVIISFAITKLNKLKNIMYGKPSYLIYNGSLDQKELLRLRISVDELLSELRQKDVADIRQVQYAILEDNGKLSVIRKSETEQSECYAHPIVIDGTVIPDELQNVKKTEEWLSKWLRKHGAKLSDVFLMTVDDSSKIHLIIKEET